MILAPSAAMPSVVTRGARLDPATADWRNAIIANGGSVDAPTLAVFDTFVRGCKADDIWDKILDCAFFVGLPNLNSILVKMKTPTGVSRTLVNTNFVSGDYTATGASAGLRKIGNTNARLETGTFANSVFTTGSGHLGVYATNFETGGTKGFIGVADVWNSVSPHALILQDSASRRGAISGSYSISPPGIATAATPVASGFELATRIANDDLRFIRNGTQSGSSQTAVNAAIPSGSIGLFALRYGTGAGPYNNTAFSAMSARAYTIGSGLTAAQALALSNRVNAVMTAFGANVY